MKNLLKLAVLAFVSLNLFSCTTDDYDAALEESVKVTENIQNAQSREGDEEDPTDIVTDTLNYNSVEGNPLVVIKKD